MKTMTNLSTRTDVNLMTKETNLVQYVNIMLSSSSDHSKPSLSQRRKLQEGISKASAFVLNSVEKKTLNLVKKSNCD